MAKKNDKSETALKKAQVKEILRPSSAVPAEEKKSDNRTVLYMALKRRRQGRK